MRLLIICSIVANVMFAQAQQYKADTVKLKSDLYEIINDLKSSYVYLNDKEVSLKCVLDKYEKLIPNIKNGVDEVLFFENLLNEFYDSHLILNTNTSSSYRLYSPVYATLKDGKAVISSIWLNGAEFKGNNIVGAEILNINSFNIQQVIDRFPTCCSNKKSDSVREWILNKSLAGRYNEPRVLTLKLKNGRRIKFDLDKVIYKKFERICDSRIEDKIGIITINNSLGNNNLVKEFDSSLDKLMNTEGLIIDLRNTVDGGNSYVARGIMSRFITANKPYQIHSVTEMYDGKTKVERSWLEYVSPRGTIYNKPVITLVGRWTGSMGEGLAIGFDGMGRAKIVGTEMERLAGEMSGFSFRHRKYGYRISTAKLFHVNGTLREKYVPEIYVVETTSHKDEIMGKGMKLIKKLKN